MHISPGSIYPPRSFLHAALPPILSSRNPPDPITLPDPNHTFSSLIPTSNLPWHDHPYHPRTTISHQIFHQPCDRSAVTPPGIWNVLAYPTIATYPPPYARTVKPLPLPSHTSLPPPHCHHHPRRNVGTLSPSLQLTTSARVSVLFRLRF